MNTGEYERMFRLEDDYWWFVARRELILFLLRRNFKSCGEAKILDIGCGTGAMLKSLEAFGAPVGVDISEEALEFCRRRGLGCLVQGNAQNLGFKDSSFDLITAVEVFEHMEDDAAGFSECFRVCRKGALFLLTVPAYDFLWSEHDEALAHKRRYSARGLKAKLEKAGFRIEKLSYAIALFFIPILCFRLTRSLVKRSGRPKTSLIILPVFLNSLLVLILKLETRLMRWVDLPFGVSIVCLARKP